MIPTQEEATEYLGLVDIGKIEVSDKLKGVLYIVSIGEFTGDVLPKDVCEEYNTLVDTLAEVLLGILEESSSLAGMNNYIGEVISHLPKADAYSFWVLLNTDTKRATKKDFVRWLDMIQSGNSFSENESLASEEYDIGIMLQVREGLMEMVMTVYWEDDEGDNMKSPISISGQEAIREFIEGLVEKPLDRSNILLYQDDSVDLNIIKHALYDPQLYKHMGEKENRLGALLKNVTSGQLSAEEEKIAMGLINANSDRKLQIHESSRLWSVEKTQSFMFHGHNREEFEIYFMEDFEVMSPKGTVYNAQSELFQEMVSFIEKKWNKGLYPLNFEDEDEVIVNCTGKVIGADTYELYITFEGVIGCPFVVNASDFHDFLMIACDIEFPIEDSVVFHQEGVGYSIYDEDDD